MQDPGPMSHLKEDLKEDGKSLIMSTIISNHRNLFSANPEICLLTVKFHNQKTKGGWFRT